MYGKMLAVAQVTVRLWNPQAVNAVFTTDWKFRKTSDSWKITCTQAQVGFFCLETLRLDVPMMVAFIAIAGVID